MFIYTVLELEISAQGIYDACDSKLAQLKYMPYFFSSFHEVIEI